MRLRGEEMTGGGLSAASFAEATESAERIVGQILVVAQDRRTIIGVSSVLCVNGMVGLPS